MFSSCLGSPFKVVAYVFSVLATLGAATGCGLHTGEDSPAAPTASYGGQGYTCIGEIPQNIDKYVNDQLKTEEITGFVRCLQNSFITFAKLTRGRDQNHYAPDEIRRFLQSYFIKKKPITDELMNQFMVLKRSLVGGDAERITRAELHVAVDVLEELRREAIRLKPHLRVLNPRLARQQDPAHVRAYIREATEALNQSIKVLSTRFRGTENPYHLNNLSPLIEEVRNYVDWTSHFPDPIPAANWVAFLKIFKELTVSPNATDDVRPQDWEPLLQSLSNWYLAYIEYEVGIKGQDKLFGDGLQTTFSLVRRVFDYAEDSVSLQPSGIVSKTQLGRLIDALYGVRWIPERVQKESLDIALDAILGKIFGDAQVPAPARQMTGITLITIAQMRDMFSRWRYVQNNLDRLRQGLPIEVTPDWADFEQVKSRMRPLFPEEDDKIVLSPIDDLEALKVEHDFYNLSIMNVIRTLVAMIVRGYSEDENYLSWDSGLTSAEMNSFYNDFRHIGIDLALVDRRNKDAGARVFIEGNLFTYAADGLNPDAEGVSGKLSFIETMELFSFLYSGGNTAWSFYNHFERNCPKGSQDDNGREKIEVTCVEQKMADVFPLVFEHMPGAKKYYSDDASVEDRSRWADILFETGLTKASLKSPDEQTPEEIAAEAEAKNWFEFSQFSTIAVVMHYTEAVMTRYDTNRNDRLDTDEAENALTVFRGLIKWLASLSLEGTISDFEVEGAFWFILHSKRLPVSTLDKISAARLGVFHGSVTLTRIDLAQIFTAIIGTLMDQPQAKQAQNTVSEETQVHVTQ